MSDAVNALAPGGEGATWPARWSIRLLLGACLGFGSEILLWSDPVGRPLWEWALLVPLYGLLAAILLDVMARWRVRDLLGLMALAGVYGLLNGLMVNPGQTLFDLPRTLVTRVTGAHTLIGLEMLTLFLCLTGGHLRHLRTLMVAGALAVGVAWGTWVRWSPIYADVTYGPVSLAVMLAVGGIGLALLLLLTALVYRRVHGVHPADMQLSARAWALMALLAVAVLLLRVAQGVLDETGLLLSLTLLVLALVILWFRRGTRLRIVLAYHLPVFPMRTAWIVLALLLFVWSGVLAYSLPLIGSEGLNQLTVISYGFTLYGLAWLPTVSVILGLRAYTRQFESHSL